VARQKRLRLEVVYAIVRAGGRQEKVEVGTVVTLDRIAAGEDGTVKLAPPARWVAEYYPNESVEEGPENSLIVKLRVADTAWLQRLVLRLGGAATVLDPEDLTTQIAATARDALSAYDV